MESGASKINETVALTRVPIGKSIRPDIVGLRKQIRERQALRVEEVKAIEALWAARAQLQERVRAHKANCHDLDRQINALIAAHNQLCQEDPIVAERRYLTKGVRMANARAVSPPGVTQDRVVVVIDAAERPLQLVEIYDRLVANGYKGSRSAAGTAVRIATKRNRILQTSRGFYMRRQNAPVSPPSHPTLVRKDHVNPNLGETQTIIRVNGHRVQEIKRQEFRCLSCKAIRGAATSFEGFACPG